VGAAGPSDQTLAVRPLAPPAVTRLDLIASGPPLAADHDMALSEALLRAVAAGERPPTLRLSRPAPTLAFGRLDALRPGFGAACAIAREHGFAPVLRVAGGHAAAYDPESLVVDELTPHEGLVAGMQERFGRAAGLLAEALRGVGVDARVGELPGEYCPGAYSLHVAGRGKVAGIAQRVVRGGALTSAVVTVGGGGRIRAVIAAVYAALGIEIDPALTGALQDADPALTPDAVQAAVIAAYARGAALVPAAADGALLARAQALRARHALG
jgi:octanoyl-[GcvH]:protein N-octanoyltransferase